MSIALALFMVPAAAGAAGFVQPESGGIKARLEAWQSTQSWSGEALYSQVVFDEEAFEKVLGRESFPMVRIGSGWYPVTNLSLVTLVGGMYESGYAIGAITGEESGEEVSLYVLPVQLNLRYRFSFMEEQVVIPSVWAGLDYWYFREINEFDDNVEGDKSGYHYGADLALLLDVFDPVAAFHMKRDYGIESTYLFAGYEWLTVGESEDGLRFSGELWSVGLRFEIVGQ